jgi:hypothetical protein
VKERISKKMMKRNYNRRLERLEAHFQRAFAEPREIRVKFVDPDSTSSTEGPDGRPVRPDPLEGCQKGDLVRQGDEPGTGSGRDTIGVEPASDPTEVEATERIDRATLKREELKKVVAAKDGGLLGSVWSGGTIASEPAYKVPKITVEFWHCKNGLPAGTSVMGPDGRLVWLDPPEGCQKGELAEDD